MGWQRDLDLLRLALTVSVLYFPPYYLRNVEMFSPLMFIRVIKTEAAETAELLVPFGVSVEQFWVCRQILQNHQDRCLSLFWVLS